MVLQISVRDDKSELFLQLIEELKNTMIEKFHIVSTNNHDFDEIELLNRINDIKYNNLKPLSREEVFDDI
ncbi:MAG TPA: hypothetical protein ENK88_07140 [Campylobacterales bacterium]|nr:hypothetical protein [Campylobacterales bacterium]